MGEDTLLWWLGFLHSAEKLEDFAAQAAQPFPSPSRQRSPPQAWAALEESLGSAAAGLQRWPCRSCVAMPVPRRTPLFGTHPAQPMQRGVCSQVFFAAGPSEGVPHTDPGHGLEASLPFSFFLYRGNAKFLWLHPSPSAPAQPSPWRGDAGNGTPPAGTPLEEPGHGDPSH